MCLTEQTVQGTAHHGRKLRWQALEAAHKHSCSNSDERITNNDQIEASPKHMGKYHSLQLQVKHLGLVIKLAGLDRD